MLPRRFLPSRRRTLEPSVGRVGRRGGADEFYEPRQRIVAVALLGAVTLSRDDQYTVAGQPPAGEPLQPRPHLMGKRRRMAHVEAQLHRGGELIDILPAGTGRADEAFRYLAVVDRDVVVVAEHDSDVRCRTSDNRENRPSSCITWSSVIRHLTSDICHLSSDLRHPIPKYACLTRSSANRSAPVPVRVTRPFSST